MISKYTITFAILSLTFLTCCQAQDKPKDKSNFPVLTGPYFGQNPPRKTPEPFAPNLLTKEYWWHSSPAFPPDRKKVYFSAFIKNEAFSERII